MQKEFKEKNIHLTYVLKRYKRSKSIRLIIHNDGALVVTAPKWVPVRSIEGFLRQKSPWIQENMSQKGVDQGLGGQHRQAHYLQHKKVARVLVLEKLQVFSVFYDLSYKKISIRNQRSRWGSWSSVVTLSFHYKIVFLPAHLANYLIVHELCHLKEMNHSKRFWTLVERAVPGYREARRELRALESKL